MYGWLWRRFPGGGLSKTACALALTLAVVALLFLVAFPAIEPHLPLTHTTVSH